MAKSEKLSYINAQLRSLAIPIAKLRLDPANARKHDDANIQTIMNSLAAYGQQKVIVVKDGVVMAGNGTLVAAKRLKWTHLAAVEYDRKDAPAVGYKLVDNRSAELATWDYEALAGQMKELPAEDLLLLGWTQADVDHIYAGEYDLVDGEGNANGSGGEDDGAAANPSDGTMLEKLSVTIAEPKTKVKHGDVFKLGKHVLIVCDPVTDTAVWLPHVTPECLFAPFPGPYAALAEIDSGKAIVMVQPDAFIAGHIVDRYRECHGK